MLTPDQAAALIGCSPHRVREYCRTGQLAGKLFGRSWLIEPQAAKRFRRPARGRPRKQV